MSDLLDLRDILIVTCRLYGTSGKFRERKTCDNVNKITQTKTKEFSS